MSVQSPSNDPNVQGQYNQQQTQEQISKEMVSAGPIKQMFLSLNPSLTPQQLNAAVTSFITQMVKQFEQIFDQMKQVTQAEKQQDQANQITLD
jgi:hypothetical protein